MEQRTLITHTSRFFNATLLLSILAMLLISSSVYANNDTIRGLVTIGMQRVFEDIKPAFMATTGQYINVEYASTSDITKRMLNGEPADFIITGRVGLDTLTTAGKISRLGYTIIGGSLVTVAVPAGYPKPDISTAEKFKNALVEAKTISYTNPASGGPSGIHLEKILHELGLTEQVRAKTIFPPFGKPVGDILARKEAEIGIQQATELVGFTGVDIVGVLPDEFQVVTEYGIAIPRNSNYPKGGQKIMDFVQSRQGKELVKAKGLDPR